MTKEGGKIQAGKLTVCDASRSTIVSEEKKEMLYLHSIRDFTSQKTALVYCHFFAIVRYNQTFEYGRTNLP